MYCRSTNCPSALETILCLTTRMSPVRSLFRWLQSMEQKFLGERIAGFDLVRRERDDGSNRSDRGFAASLRRLAPSTRALTAAELACGRLASCHCRTRRWERVSPGAARQCAQVFRVVDVERDAGQREHDAGLSGGLGRSVMRRKLSLPKRSGKQCRRDVARWRWCRVHRRREPAPSLRAGADSMNLLQFPAWIRGMSPGITSVLSIPLASQKRSPFRWRRFRRDWRRRE